MSEGGLEPPRPCGHQPLKLARLPIPPLRPVNITVVCYRPSRLTFRPPAASYHNRRIRASFLVEATFRLSLGTMGTWLGANVSGLRLVVRNSCKQLPFGDIEEWPRSAYVTSYPCDPIPIYRKHRNCKQRQRRHIVPQQLVDLPVYRC